MYAQGIPKADGLVVDGFDDLKGAQGRLFIFQLYLSVLPLCPIDPERMAYGPSQVLRLNAQLHLVLRGASASTCGAHER